jgi:hypothetical protein
MRLPARSAGARVGARARRLLLPLQSRVSDERGFTIVEVLAATLILVAGLIVLFGMLISASHVMLNTRLRQEETSLAREALEDSRGLTYAQLTPTTIASALQPQVPGASLSGSNLSVTRTINSSTPYTFNVSLSVCSLDDPSDGYGDHSSPPLSGGVWCADVAPSGTADSNPDDYKRVSVTVTPSSGSTRPIQQTILIYQRPVNGPAVSCLSTSSTCPGPNVTVGPTGGASLTFNVTTTTTADRIRWLVNGNPPPAAQIPSGNVDPYAPSGTSSSFSWNFPTTTVGSTVYTVDGTYTITAIAYDANGNSGTRSTVIVKVNEHPVLAPVSPPTVGWNDLTGGVEIQWVPSVDQDVLYYHVYHSYNGLPAQLLTTCGNVTGVSCADAPESAFAPPIPSARPNPCTSTNQTYTTTDFYWVVGVDTDPNGTLREGTPSQHVDANLCDHQPNALSSLTKTVNGGQVTLSWTPPSPADPDSWDQIQAWRVYRWPSSRGVQIPGDRYELVGNGPPAVTSYTDTSPDPGGVQQSYCVTAVDSHLNESPCSPIQTQ